MTRSALITGKVMEISSPDENVYRYVINDDKHRILITEWIGENIISIGNRVMMKGEKRVRKVNSKTESYIAVSQLTLF